MTITYELDLDRFEGWSGADDTLYRVRSEGKIGLLEQILDDTYPEGMTETELNDLLRYESETILHEWLGLDTVDSIDDEIKEKEEELQDLEDAFQEYVEDEELTPEERNEIWENEYKEDIESLKEEIAELEERRAEL